MLAPCFLQQPKEEVLHGPLCRKGRPGSVGSEPRVTPLSLALVTGNLYLNWPRQTPYLCYFTESSRMTIL